MMDHKQTLRLYFKRLLKNHPFTVISVNDDNQTIEAFRLVDLEPIIVNNKSFRLQTLDGIVTLKYNFTDDLLIISTLSGMAIVSKSLHSNYFKDLPELIMS